MANESRRGGGPFGGRGGQNGDRGGRGGRGGRFNSSERERERERDRSPVREDRMRDSYPEPYRGGGGGGGRGSRLPPYPPGGDFGPRDPYFPEPYRRGGGFPDPWFGDDPYRPDPYAEPYRDPYRIRPPPPPIECEIFVLNGQLRAYGETVERKIKEHKIITAVSVIPEGRTPQQLVEEVTTQNALFAIFINVQNEVHRSLTVNILHGTPQEHRNMPLDDAISLVGRSFLKYIDGLREKVQAPPVVPTRVFLPPSSEVIYLLNLLADSRAVTIAELDTVIKYLQERREKLIDAESRPVITDDSFIKGPSVQRLEKPQPSSQDIPVGAVAGNKDPAATHLELTNKILSLFTGSGGVQGVPPANGTQQQQVNLPKQLPSGTPAPASQPQGQPASSASLINFDNPNVQKALDNLIQSTPNLLKNFGAKMSASSPQMSPANLAASMGALFGHGLGGMLPGQGGGMGPNNQGMGPNNQGMGPNNQGMGNQQGGFGGLQGQLGAQGQGAQGQGAPGSSQSVYSTGISGQGRGYAPHSQQRF